MHSFFIFRIFPCVIQIKISCVILKNCMHSRAPATVSKIENLKQTFMNLKSYEQKKHKLLASLVANPLCQAALQSALSI